MPQAICCSCAARFVSDLVRNPEDRFSHNEAHIIRLMYFVDCDLPSQAAGFRENLLITSPLYTPENIATKGEDKPGDDKVGACMFMSYTVP